jgi:hypothetical protein
VRATTSSGTIPSGSGRCRGLDGGSANRTSRQKKEEVKGYPADEEHRHGDRGNDERPYRSVPQRLRRLIRRDRRGDMFRPIGGGVNCGGDEYRIDISNVILGVPLVLPL